MCPLDKQEYIHFKGQNCLSLRRTRRNVCPVYVTYTKVLSSYYQALKKRG